MTRISLAIRRYPVVAITILIGLVSVVLALSGHESVARWGISAFALVIAAVQAWGMLKDLFKGKWGIDVLAIMAIIATVVVGEYWASLIIVLMLSGGEALEDFAAGRAKRELSALLARAPQIAHRHSDESGSIDIPVDDVVVGDLLLVKPAEVVPVDGVLISAAATLDESSLTGESLPVEHAEGDAILSGALNGEGAFMMRATALSIDSQYQRIIGLVAEASSSRAPVVRLADRYAVPFTIVSLAIAGVAWLLSGDPVRFAEVLVVATPCPLLIAAPVAFMGGMSRAARNGVIVKSGGTLETLSRAKTVAFDKTGTLTHGEPTVVEVRPAGAISADELFSYIASAEQYSSHVLASSLIAGAKERGLTLLEADSAREIATNGVIAQFGDHEVVVGKRSFIESHAAGVSKTPLVSGQLAVYVALDGEFAGAIVLSDRLRSNAAPMLADLQRLGVRHTMILTGDAAATAHHVALELGVSDVHADLLPADKVSLVREASHRPVVMVGDGVNDAPVLAAADVGIAMGAKGSTAASESADVVIMLDDISRVATAISVGHRTMRVAIQSIWLGIGLSVALMLLGAFGFLPAVVGAVMQEVVDLATILNALRALSGGRERQPTVVSPVRAAMASAAAPGFTGTTPPEASIVSGH